MRTKLRSTIYDLVEMIAFIIACVLVLSLMSGLITRPTKKPIINAINKPHGGK